MLSLLTYTPLPLALTKAGKVAKQQPKDTHKDEEVHFYNVQLVHYRLKPLKTHELANWLHLMRGKEEFGSTQGSIRAWSGTEEGVKGIGC